MSSLRLWRLLLVAALALGGYSLPLPESSAASAPSSVTEARRAFEAGRSGVWLRAEGTVIRVLRDDLKGRRHQRFLVRLSGGLTLLVSHNIDIASRVPVEVGHGVAAFGRYEWNRKGGILHWTHRDPRGRRAGGWILHGGKTYR